MIIAEVLLSYDKFDPVEKPTIIHTIVNKRRNQKVICEELITVPGNCSRVAATSPSCSLHFICRESDSESTNDIKLPSA